MTSRSFSTASRGTAEVAETFAGVVKRQGVGRAGVGREQEFPERARVVLLQAEHGAEQHVAGGHFLVAGDGVGRESACAGEIVQVERADRALVDDALEAGVGGERLAEERVRLFVMMGQLREDGVMELGEGGGIGRGGRRSGGREAGQRKEQEKSGGLEFHGQCGKNPDRNQASGSADCTDKHGRGEP